ncbi:MAG: hypothetical protein U1F36_09900 [Planctomycetota bacterium]
MPRFHKLTFQKGSIYSARFAPDGQTVVYGAAWGGGAVELYSARIDAMGSRRMGVPADILGISRSGEMALSLGRHIATSLLSLGRLARAPLGGGASRDVLDGVVDADWSADGTELAVTREVSGEALLEFPNGTVLHRAGGHLSSPRIAPDGGSVALIVHQVKGDDRGAVAIVDRKGKATVLISDLPSVTGLAWSPRGDEVWFSAWMPPSEYLIEAVTPSGARRTVYTSGARMRLFDVLGDRVLLGHENANAGMSGMLAGDERERDYSFLDGSCPTDMSVDGAHLLFSEAWIGGGAGYSFYLRDAASDFPVRLGEGWGSDLSADGKWTLSYPVDPPMRLLLTPTGTGQPRTIELGGFEAAGGAPHPITPPGVVPPMFSSVSHALSPDGSFVAVTEAERGFELHPVAGTHPFAARREWRFADGTVRPVRNL